LLLLLECASWRKASTLPALTQSRTCVLSGALTLKVHSSRDVAAVTEPIVAKLGELLCRIALAQAATKTIATIAQKAISPTCIYHPKEQLTVPLDL